MSNFYNKNNEELCNELNQWENILIKICNVITWKKPFLSLFSIVCVNILFWLIIYLDFKFYGIIFSTFLTLNFVQLWNNQISQFFKKKTNLKNETWSSASRTTSPGAASSSNCNIVLSKNRKTLKNLCERVKFLRQTQPEGFCALVVFFFTLLSFVGKSISDVTSLYILLMLVMTVPGIAIHFLPPYVVSSLSNIICSSHKDHINNADEVESFLPETSQEALEVLRLAADSHCSNKGDDEDSTDILLECIGAHSNDTTESLSSRLSFYPDSAVMPSPEHSMDFLEIEHSSGDSSNKNAEFNQSDDKDIHFLSKHFNGDSSDEEEFIKGLKLTDEGSKKIFFRSTNIEESILNSAKLISIGASFLNTTIQHQNIGKSDAESSSDTDSFEMISEKDV